MINSLDSLGIETGNQIDMHYNESEISLSVD
jgi:hypothetical protein